jgi:Ca-activated chloride channel family protein
VTRGLFLTAAVLAGSAGTQEPQPTFRARTELVRVDVLVTDDGAPVAGLTAADFEVRDNGVGQRVTAAGTVESVQLGVVLDVSGSMTGERLAIARKATTDLLGRLTRGDRFAVVAFGDQVGRVTGPGASAAEAAAALDRVQAGGSTALLDGTYAGILEADGGPGPKLLLVMTDGRNNTSWLQARPVIDTARRHETVIYPVAVDVDDTWDGGISMRLRTSDAVALLEAMADQTGGRYVEAGWDRSLGERFQQILREYRQRYILTFTPEGVPAGDGWHALEVKVKRPGARVRARTRYWAGRD